MLSGSDLLALRRAFLELQITKWSFLNGYGNLTSRAFHQCIIVNTLLHIRRHKTGVQRQLPAPFQASSAQRAQLSVQRPIEDPLSGIPCPRDYNACGPHQSSAQTFTKQTPEVDFSTKQTVLPLLVIYLVFKGLNLCNSDL